VEGAAASTLASVSPESAPPVETSSPAFDGVEGTRFVEDHEIGRGGMGRVFEAHDRNLDRPVAVKQSLTRDAADLARFEREVTITARLQHPNIVPVLDAGRDDTGRPFYVMRKIEGRPLVELIDEATTVEQRLALVPRILGAVDAAAYAHARGVIHRDIKSWNVLLGPFGETLLIDWGLAREIDADDPESASRSDATEEGLTIAGQAYGTPGFMPPEQARGDRLDRRADVFALGAMLYHAVVGEPPLHGLKPADAVARAAAGSAIDPSKIPQDVPRALATVIAKATAREPDDRYADAGELADDLRKFTAGQLVSAHHYTIGELLRRWLRRHVIAVVIAVVAVVVLAVVGAIAFEQVMTQRERAMVAKTEEQVRADELVIARANQIVMSDPTRAVAELKLLRDNSPTWKRAFAVYDSAMARGVARVRTAHPNARAMKLAASPEGDLVATIGDDGNVLLHDPAFRLPMRQLAKLDEPEQLVWYGRSLVVVEVGGGVYRIELDGKVTKLAAGGSATWVVGSRRGVFVTTRTEELREIDVDGGPSRVVATGVTEVAQLDGALLYYSGTSLVYHPLGGKPTVLAEGVDEVHQLVVRADRRRFAAATFAQIIEWEMSPQGPVERDRWNLGLAHLIYAGSGLHAEVSGQFQWLSRHHKFHGEPYVAGSLRSLTGDSECGYLSTTTPAVWMLCPDYATPIGGNSDLVMGLALASGYLVGITSTGLMLSWDLRQLSAGRLRASPGNMAIAFAGGLVWSSTISLEAMDVATGEVLDLGVMSLACLTGKHGVLASARPSPTPRIEVFDLVTRKRTPITGGFHEVGCARDDRMVLVANRRLEIRALADPLQPVSSFEVDHDADLIFLEGGYLTFVTLATGVFEQIEIATNTRTRFVLRHVRWIAADDNGHVAAIREDNETFLWTGGPTPWSLGIKLVGLGVNPAGLFGWSRENSITVIGPWGELRTYHAGTGFTPTFANDLPLATMPGPDGSIVVIDLVDGVERHIGMGLHSAWIDPTGTRVLGTTFNDLLTWPITTLPPQALRPLLERSTNARVAAGSTRIEIDEPVVAN